jgi:hypothetical protein
VAGDDDDAGLGLAGLDRGDDLQAVAGAGRRSVTTASKISFSTRATPAVAVFSASTRKPWRLSSSASIAP